uniref:exodeoxyribonuclease III n=1 Tax=Podarcis muralis TaxID=64176 RepID=A0A670HMS3_PODMU
MSLTFLTWNVNGLNDKLKRNKIEKALRNKKCDVVCCQETHVAKKHRHILVNKKLGMEFINSDMKKKRGLVIYVREKLEPKMICKDEEGRILGIQITHQGERLNVVSVYAPNANKAEFFKKLEQILLELENYKLILLGDLNGVPEPEIDRSEKRRKGRQGKLPKTFDDLQENLDLIDIWRFKNPIDKKFTHFSGVHQSWGRIDQIWVSRELSIRSAKCEIEPRTLSDHNPIFLEIKCKSLGPYRWRMNDQLMEQDETIGKAKNILKEYFDLNLNKETKIDVVWDASKAVLRGFLIQQNKYRKNLREAKKEEIIKQLKEAEGKLTINPGDERTKQICKLLQTQYSTLYIEQNKRNIGNKRDQNWHKRI